MSERAFPELPEPVYWAGGGRFHDTKADATEMSRGAPVAVFIADQMTAYAHLAFVSGADHALDLLVAAGRISRETAFQARDIVKDAAALL